MGRPKGVRNKTNSEQVLIVERSVNDDTSILKDSSARQAAASLATHPGFKYLMAKLRATRDFARATLEQRPFSDLREVIQAQAAVFWAGWLEQQVYDVLPALKPAQTESSPESEVADLLRKARANLVVVGVKDSQSLPQVGEN